MRHQDPWNFRVNAGFADRVFLELLFVVDERAGFGAGNNHNQVEDGQ